MKVAGNIEVHVKSSSMFNKHVQLLIWKLFESVSVLFFKFRMFKFNVGVGRSLLEHTYMLRKNLYSVQMKTFYPISDANFVVRLPV